MLGETPREEPDDTAVRLPPLGPAALDPAVPPGWIKGKIYLHALKRWLYVSRGIGTSGVPVRLFCSPEVTDLTFRVVPRPAR